MHSISDFNEDYLGTSIELTPRGSTTHKKRFCNATLPGPVRVSETH